MHCSHTIEKALLSNNPSPPPPQLTPNMGKSSEAFNNPELSQDPLHHPLSLSIAFLTALKQMPACNDVVFSLRGLSLHSMCLVLKCMSAPLFNFIFVACNERSQHLFVRTGRDFTNCLRGTNRAVIFLFLLIELAAVSHAVNSMNQKTFLHPYRTSHIIKKKCIVIKKKKGN